MNVRRSVGRIWLEAQSQALPSRHRMQAVLVGFYESDRSAKARFVLNKRDISAGEE